MPDSQRRAAAQTQTQARTDLLAATRRLLVAQGPERLTSRAIAQVAEANLASITYYFGSKDNLVAEAMVGVARELIEPVVVQLESHDTEPVTNLLNAVQLLYRIFNENRSQLPGYIHTLASATNDGPARAEIQALHHRLGTVLATAIAEQQQQALLPTWIEPEPMAQLIVAAVNGVVIAAATNPDTIDETAIGAQLAQLLLSVRTTPETSGPGD